MMSDSSTSSTLIFTPDGIQISSRVYGVVGCRTEPPVPAAVPVGCACSIDGAGAGAGAGAPDGPVSGDGGGGWPGSGVWTTVRGENGVSGWCLSLPPGVGVQVVGWGGPWRNGTATGETTAVGEAGGGCEEIAASIGSGAGWVVGLGCWLCHWERETRVGGRGRVW